MRSLAGNGTSVVSVPARRISFEQAASLALGQFQTALSNVLLAAAGEVHKAADVERALGVDRKLCWQIYRIVTASNPLAAGVHMPARVSLERLLKATAKKGASAQLRKSTLEAFEGFERLVAEHAGDRREFDSLVASSLPEERERIQVASRESLYEAARTIRGVAVEASLFAGVFYPSREDPSRLDVARVSGWFGLRRIRRGAHIEYALKTSGREKRAVTTIDGGPINDIADVVMEGFSSDPTPRLVAHTSAADETSIRYVLQGEDVGVRAAVDIAFADFMPAPIGRYATRERPTIGVSYVADNPTRWNVVDVLVGEGVVPVQSPEVRVYDIVPNGPVPPVPGPERDLDRVPFEPSARYMGSGLESFRTLYVPRYVEMLERVCQSRGWDASRLHGYRVELEYPVYSWDTVLRVKLPGAAEARPSGRV